MGKIFWIACGVVLVVAIGLWGGLTLGVQGKVATKRAQVGKLSDQLQTWAHKKQNEIRNQSDMAVERDHMTALKTEDEAMQGLMLERNLSIEDDKFSSAPPRDDVASFKMWLLEECRKENDKLKATMTIPETLRNLGEIDDWGGTEEKDIPGLLRDFRIKCEVFRVLEQASAEVRYVAAVPDDKGKVKNIDQREVMKVLALGSIEIGEGTGERRGGASKPGAGDAKERLYDARSLTLKFTAHYAVALDVIRKLESSKDGVFLVSSARISAVDPRSAVAEGYTKTAGREAPVEVELRASLFRFIEQAPEPPAKETKGPKRGKGASR